MQINDLRELWIAYLSHQGLSSLPEAGSTTFSLT
jgi:hypothetical protein